MKNMNKELVQIGENIRQCRKNRGCTQEQLAEKIDVSTITISRIENGENAMNILTFCEIMRCLDASPEELLKINMFDMH